MLRWLTKALGINKRSHEDARYLDDIGKHLARHFEAETRVLHEGLISGVVHLDTFVLAPTDSRPFWTMVTSGMSDLPMSVPEFDDREDLELAELLVAVPGDWAKEPMDLVGNEAGVAFRLMRDLASYVHEQGAWLGPGHTGELAEPISDGSPNNAWLIWPPQSWPQDARTLRLHDGKRLNFYAIYILNEEELVYSHEGDRDKLLGAFEESGMYEIVDPRRPSFIENGEVRLQ